MAHTSPWLEDKAGLGQRQHLASRVQGTGGGCPALPAKGSLADEPPTLGCLHGC